MSEAVNNTNKANKRLILASKSARRHELLTLCGAAFTTMVSDAPEDDSPLDLTGVEFAGDDCRGDGVVAKVTNIACRKAMAVAARVCADSGDSGAAQVILAADTVVALGDELIGKPRDLDDAVSILRRLSDKTHRVVTVCVITDGARTLIRPTVTNVTFRALTEREINGYVHSCEVLDKAGAYGIQDRAALFVERIEGDYYNIVGLPVCHLRGDLARFGIEI